VGDEKQEPLMMPGIPRAQPEGQVYVIEDAVVIAPLSAW
jgi:hypothetical protein